MQEEQNVYDEVDEKDYEKLVLSRADDWIEDGKPLSRNAPIFSLKTDINGRTELNSKYSPEFHLIYTDGTGYYDDGREIFDEDEEDVEETKTKDGKNKKGDKPKKRLRDINKPVEGKSSIRSMFSNVVPAKKKDVKVEDDQVLANLLNELDSDDNKASGSGGMSAANGNNKTNTKLVEKAEIKNFMADFTRKPEKPKIESTSDDVSIIFPKIYEEICSN